ncbi:MAG: phosphoserine phosphatase SerB [Gemmatimonadota bacterium]
MSEIILVTVSGRDRPGLTASLTEILAAHGIDILDIGQAVIHDTYSLGVLTEIPQGSASSPVLKDLVFRAHELGLDIHFTPVSAVEYGEWVAHQQRQRYIISILSRHLNARQISTIARIVSDHGLNIDDITRLSERVPLDRARRPGRACLELRVRGQPRDLEAMRARFMEVSGEVGADIAFQEDNLYRRNRRLVCLDMDSTLVPWEIIDELAAAAGVGPQVAAITERAMRGELDFADSFRQRLALLAGLPESVLAATAARMPLTEGAERLVANLKTLGYKVAILSGGFTYFARHLQQRLGLDYVYANELEIADGRVTGRVAGAIVDGQRKAELLREIARQENISLEQVVAVGDGANDLPMLTLAGLGIAFRAKPVVREGARQSISTVGLDGILYLMGIRDRETRR